VIDQNGENGRIQLSGNNSPIDMIISPTDFYCSIVSCLWFVWMEQVLFDFEA
jgi:hypothetical protein